MPRELRGQRSGRPRRCDFTPSALTKRRHPGGRDQLAHLQRAAPKARPPRKRSGPTDRSGTTIWRFSTSNGKSTDGDNWATLCLSNFRLLARACRRAPKPPPPSKASRPSRAGRKARGHWRFAGAPHYAPRRRLNETRAARIPILKWRSQPRHRHSIA
jgi:hypothetical protein